MKLYMHPASTTCRPVRLFAADNKIAMDEEFVDLMTGAHMQPGYAAVNPNCLVPMLEDGDLRLTESSAILKYLADKIGSPAYPKDLKQRAKVNEMMDWLNTNFYRDWGYNLCYPQLFPDMKRRSDEAQAATLEYGKDNAKRWLKMLNDHWIGPNKHLSVRQPRHHRRLFRRRPGDAGRGHRRRFFALSERQALARRHEKAAELGQGQRGLQWSARSRERPEIRQTCLAWSELRRRHEFLPRQGSGSGRRISATPSPHVVVPRTVDLGDGSRCGARCRRRARAWSGRSSSSIISARPNSAPATAWTCGRIRISGLPPSPICSTARSCTATASAPRSRSSPARSTG